MIVIDAFGTILPLSSSTFPFRVAVVSCAETIPPNKVNIRAVEHSRKAFRIYIYLAAKNATKHYEYVT